MSSSIWTRCGGGSNLRALRLEPVRVVEAQHQVSTRKLVRSDAEQEVLERLLESVKPPDPTGGRLHYLLFTPFRYPPLRHGSRFGTRLEPGLWYGSETLHTAFAEAAYYRLLFLAGTQADLGSVVTQLTTFTVRVTARRGVDLTRPPFAAHHRTLRSRTRYDATQILGSAMRAVGVEAFRFESARDRDGGVNVGIFSPVVFGRSRPRRFRGWYCTATEDQVEMMARDYFERTVYRFDRRRFLVRGRLPAPAP